MFLELIALKATHVTFKYINIAAPFCIALFGSPENSVIHPNKRYNRMRWEN